MTEQVLDQSYYKQKISRGIQVWLAIGLFMIFIQVVVGGITRLTGSGLSITKWEIVTGTFPPMNDTDWNVEFDKYKATPQYEKLNRGMSLKDFKFIYFWEYFHRLWARSMGLVFIFPFIFFLVKRQIPKKLLKRLIIVILMAAVVASFGWIMVASGLVDRPWVNAYKLTLHLSLALILFSYLLWTFLSTAQPTVERIQLPKMKKLALWITGITCLQIIFGGFMSGMHAGLLYPTWPDMNGEVVPAIIFEGSNYTVENLKNYDSNGFMPSLVQVLHRTTAYILTGLIIWFFVKMRKQEVSTALSTGVKLLLGMLFVQFTLGVMTIINCIGTIPVGWGVIHQGGAVILLSFALFVNYQFRYPHKV